MVWGMFPYFELHISWESHMLGAVSGLILAFWFKDTGLQNTYPDWYYEEDDNEFSGEQEESSGN
jgi:hypothetical protein